MSELQGGGPLSHDRAAAVIGSNASLDGEVQKRQRCVSIASRAPKW